MSEDSPAVLSGSLLAGRRVIITGGAGGIGRATVKLFVEHGARLTILDVNDQGLADLRALYGDGHLYLNLDVADRAACQRAVDETLKGFGGLDALVTMAGVVPPGAFATLTQADYDAVMDSHVRGTFNMCQTAAPVLRAQKRGTIVCMSSIAAERGGGLHGGSHYAAAKGAVLSFSRALARELGPDNVRVNAVCPGATWIGQRPLEEMNAWLSAQIPMRRVGFGHEIAACFLFLASDLAGFVTGATLDVNGGMHIG